MLGFGGWEGGVPKGKVLSMELTTSNHVCAL